MQKYSIPTADRNASFANDKLNTFSVKCAYQFTLIRNTIDEYKYPVNDITPEKTIPTQILYNDWNIR